jgi:hypothetical protein
VTKGVLAGFGFAPASGDVDGDGVSDLLVGAPYESSSTGASYLFYGPITSGAILESDADASFLGDAANDWTGGSNSAEGDLDGDGIDDVVVGAEQWDDGGTDNGAAWVFYGPVTGTHVVADADVRVVGAPDGAHFGWTTKTGGDVDGDGRQDLAVASPIAGAVYVFSGDSIGSVDELDASVADAFILGAEGGDLFGAVVDTAGDFDDDGCDDLAVGAMAHDAINGAVYVFYGPLSGSSDASTADFDVTGEYGEYLGSGVSFAGDLDGDGVDDLGLGAYSHGDTTALEWYRGAAYVFYGLAR